MVRAAVVAEPDAGRKWWWCGSNESISGNPGSPPLLVPEDWRRKIHSPILELAHVKAGMVEKRYQLLLAGLAEGDAIGGKLPLQPLECIDFRRVRKQWHVTLDPVLAIGDPVRLASGSLAIQCGPLRELA